MFEFRASLSTSGLPQIIQGKIQGHNLYIFLEALCVRNIVYHEKFCQQILIIILQLL